MNLFERLMHYPERRDPSERFCEHSAVVLKPLKEGDNAPFIDANVLVTKQGGKWIMAGAPLDGTEDGKRSTLERFWMMIHQQKVAVIAQLCNFDENGEKACARYYPETVEDGELEFGVYKVKTLEEINLGEQFNEEREHFSALRVQYTYQGISSHTVDILRYFNWPKEVPPETIAPAVDILLFLEAYKTQTVLVHCSTGYGRTGMLTGMRIGLNMLEADVPNQEAMFEAVRGHRGPQCLRNVVEQTYMFLGNQKLLFKKYKIYSFQERYATMIYYYGSYLRRIALTGRPEPDPAVKMAAFVKKRKDEFRARRSCWRRVLSCTK